MAGNKYIHANDFMPEKGPSFLMASCCIFGCYEDVLHLRTRLMSHVVALERMIHLLSEHAFMIHCMQLTHFVQHTHPPSAEVK